MSSSSSNLNPKEHLNPFINSLYLTTHRAAQLSNEISQECQDMITPIDFKELMHENVKSLSKTIKELSQKHGNSYEVSNSDDLEVEVEDLTDFYLENVDRALDELNTPEHLNNDPKTPQKSQVLAANSRLFSSPQPKPQLKWKRTIDNSNSLFNPPITEKPNALVSLEKIMSQKFVEYHPEIEAFPFPKRGSGIGGDVRRDSRPHPYLPELQDLEFLPEQLQHASQMSPPGDLKNTPCVWIDTKSALLKLASELDAQKDFAIDLEHHSFRTFQGFCCLMQISTRTCDYIIDTIQLRDDMYVLNTSFTNPKIVKVMHGADCDILWLQRDFGIYVVNLFDTGQAARMLSFPSISYAHVLRHYCGIFPDKKYQLADWRVRPLPSVMIEYARADTHYLLYIYDRIRNDILDSLPSSQNSLLRVLQQSKIICMRRYENFIFDEWSYTHLRKRFLQPITDEEDRILKELYRWRDEIARKEDESIRYVLMDQTLVYIVEQKPDTQSKLIRLIGSSSPLARDHAESLVNLIKKSREDSTQPIRRVHDTRNSEGTDGDGRAISRDSPIMSREELFSEAHWLSRSDSMGQIISLDDPSDAMEDSSFVETGSSSASSSDRKTSVAVAEMETSLFSSNIHQSGWDPMEVSPLGYSQFPTQDAFPQPRPTSYHQRQLSGHSIVSSSSSGSQSSSNSNSNSLFSSSVFDNKLMGQTKTVGPDVETPLKTSSKQDRERATPPEERLPESLNDIYKLSQNNRKKNKQKKKLKQSSVADPRPAYSPETALAVDENNAEDFMKQIGWEIPSKSPEPVNQEAPPSHNEKSSSSAPKRTYSKSSRTHGSTRGGHKTHRKRRT